MSSNIPPPIHAVTDPTQCLNTHSEAGNWKLVGYLLKRVTLFIKPQLAFIWFKGSALKDVQLLRRPQRRTRAPPTGRGYQRRRRISHEFSEPRRKSRPARTPLHSQGTRSCPRDFRNPAHENTGPPWNGPWNRHAVIMWQSKFKKS